MKGFLSELGIAITITVMFTIEVCLPIYWSHQIEKLNADSPSKVSSAEDSFSEEKNEITKRFKTEEDLEEFKRFLASEFCLENLLVIEVLSI